MTQDTTEILKREDIHQHTKAVCVLLDALQEIENLAAQIQKRSRGLNFNDACGVIFAINEARAATKALNKEDA